MTLASIAAPAGRARSRFFGVAVGRGFIGLAALTLWMAGHSFSGMKHDARIYMGRALADLDPNGVGRDMMFVFDGQSGFSLFRFVARSLVAVLGVGPTTELVSLCGILVWFAAVVTLARALVPGRGFAPVLLTALVLPRAYSAWNVFAAGEVFATPRPFAEAGVLFAMAALCKGRVWRCVACLVGAALIHPIMAAPGFGVLLVVLGLRDKRWLFAVAGLAALAVLAGLLGLPLVDRLTMRLDPAWYQTLVDRTPYLFIGKWPLEALVTPLVVRGVTLLLAALWVPREVRAILLASFAVGLVGVLASFVLGDGLWNVLFLQAQVWRGLWLAAAIAPLAAGICLWHLPRQGPAGQVAAALLAVAWMTIAWFPLGPVAAALAAVAYFGMPHVTLTKPRTVVLVVFAACGLVALIVTGVGVWLLIPLLRGRPPEAGPVLPLVWGSGSLVLPVMLLILAWRQWPSVAATRICAGLAVALGVLIVATSWDTRSPATADGDTGPKTDLAGKIATRPGEVLWIGTDRAWTWLGKGNWVNSIQGGAAVFSRDLALKWRARASAAIAAGLAHPRFLAPWTGKDTLEPTDLDESKIKAFCLRPDAPAWIISAVEPGMTIPADLGAWIWRSPYVDLDLITTADSFRWRRFDRYAVIACHAANRP